jgi:hypothetical protein
MKKTKSNKTIEERNARHLNGYDIIYDALLSVMPECSDFTKMDLGGLKTSCEIMEKIQKGQRLAWGETGENAGDRLKMIFDALSRNMSEE